MQIFDMDGTLIDSNGIWKDVDTAFLAKRGLPYTRAYYEGVAHTIFPLAAKFTKEFCHLPESEEAIMAEWMDMAGDLYGTSVPVKPGVRAYLEKLRDAGERMMVVTSAVPVHCRTALTHLGLMPYFERIVFAQELHREKKDPALWRLAAETAYFSGASLENLLNEAAIFAAQREDEEITLGDVRAALIRTTVGADRESAATAAEKRVIAVHEAGHAVALRMLTPNSRLTRVSILPAGRGAAGYNLAVPGEKVMLSKADMENQICVLLAGRAAELLAGGDDALTAGAASDLTRAGELAAAMVTELGMAGEPSVSLKALSRVCGGMPGAQEQCRALLQQQFERTQRLMLQHSDALLRLTEALVENESLTGEEVEAVLSSENAESTKAD